MEVTTQAPASAVAPELLPVTAPLELPPELLLVWLPLEAPELLPLPPPPLLPPAPLEDELAAPPLS